MVLGWLAFMINMVSILRTVYGEAAWTTTVYEDFNYGVRQQSRVLIAFIVDSLL